MHGYAWVILMRCTLFDHEKRGGLSRPNVQMEDFRNSLAGSNLCDLGAFGPRFTWSNKRPDADFVTERLDRALATSEFITRFPTLRVDVFIGKTKDGICTQSI
jgi:hypothetical protein